MIVDGCNAEIYDNNIRHNTKANIAFGGASSSKTKVFKNKVSYSKSEGIFVVEGENGLTIDSNEVFNNADGIVLLDSHGTV